MREALRNALGGDLTGVCLCGPTGRKKAVQKEILAVLGAIQASGHDHKDVVSVIRSMGGGKLSGFTLNPELNHYGACVPAELLVLAAEQSRLS